MAKKPTYSLRWLLLLVTLACVLGGYFNYRKQAAKPDLGITAEDVAWATGARVWKIDLAEAGEFYGLSVVTIKSVDLASKERYGQIGGFELLDVSTSRLLTVSMMKSGGSAKLKLHCGGAGMSLEIDDFLEPSRSAYARNPPRIDGNLIYLASDSRTIGVGAKPFDSNSNVIAIEILREPTH